MNLLMKYFAKTLIYLNLILAGYNISSFVHFVLEDMPLLAILTAVASVLGIAVGVMMFHLYDDYYTNK